MLPTVQIAREKLLAMALDDLLMPPAFLVPLVSPNGASVSYISDRCGANNIWFRPLAHPGQDRRLTREQGKGKKAMGFAGQAVLRGPDSGSRGGASLDHRVTSFA